MKNIIGFVLFISTIQFGFAQQMPQYSQYLRNQFMVNPGAAGVYNFTDVTVSGRMQWLGFTNAPMTSYASVTTLLSKNQKERYNPSLHISSGPIKSPEVKTGKLKHAIGGQLVGDQYGAFRKVQFSGTYAIHIPVSPKYNISFGTRLGISNNAFLQDKAIVKNQATDGTYTDYTANQATQNIMNIGAGLYFYSDKSFFGVAADQLTRNMVNFGSSTANFDPTIHINITGGIKLPVTPDLTITPAFLVKYMSPAPPSIEGTIQAEYKERFWGGLSYRNKDAVIIMAGLNISQRFKFGYSYDYSISRFNNYSSGGHELILGIMLR